jgi:hypothetical protein
MCEYSFEDWKNLTASIQSLVTALSLILAGLWACYRFGLFRERFSHIEFSADIELIGMKDGWWIAEVMAIIENKGRSLHEFKSIDFDLNALCDQESVELSPRWNNQVHFQKNIAKESFRPSSTGHFFIDPGITAKYSHLTRVPTNARFLNVHCRFEYVDRRNCNHTAEKTIQVPIHPPTQGAHA